MASIGRSLLGRSDVAADGRARAVAAGLPGHQRVRPDRRGGGHVLVLRGGRGARADHRGAGAGRARFPGAVAPGRADRRGGAEAARGVEPGGAGRGLGSRSPARSPASTSCIRASRVGSTRPAWRRCGATSPRWRPICSGLDAAVAERLALREEREAMMRRVLNTARTARRVSEPGQALIESKLAEWRRAAEESGGGGADRRRRADRDARLDAAAAAGGAGGRQPRRGDAADRGRRRPGPARRPGNAGQALLAAARGAHRGLSAEAAGARQGAVHDLRGRPARRARADRGARAGAGGARARPNDPR